MTIKFTRHQAQGAQALDHNQEVFALDGYAVVSGCGVSPGTNAYDVDVDAGEVLRGDPSAPVTVNAQTVSIDTPGSEPRKDILYVDSTGTVLVEKGKPQSAYPEDKRAEMTQFPAPSDFAAGPETILTEIYVDPNREEIKSDDVVDRRFFASAAFASADIEEILADLMDLGLAGRTADPTLSAGLLWHRDDEDLIKASPDGTTTIALGWSV